MRRHANRIASACLADGWYIDCRATMPANDVLPILAIALGPADAASIQRGPIAIRLLNNHKAQRLPSGADRKQMHLTVLHIAYRNTHFIPHGCDGPCRGGRSIRVRVNE